MGIDFNKTPVQPQQPVQSQPVIDITPAEEKQEYNIVAQRETWNTQLVGSKEVDTLVSRIDLSNVNSIVTFGADAANEIAKASDVVLRNVNLSQLDDASEMLGTLAKIMSVFDIDEIKENPGFFDKLFGGQKKRIEKILGKYNNMGEQVDKIYVQLKTYESEINQSNKNLEDMFNANVEYYHQLVKYILAAEQGCQEIESYIGKRKQDLSDTGDTAIQFEIQSCEQALAMLEQRTHDLRTAESVAMQSIPLRKTME